MGGQHRHIEAEGRSRHRQKLEVSGMGRKDDEWTRIVAQLQKVVDADDFDTTGLRLLRVVIEQAVEETYSAARRPMFPQLSSAISRRSSSVFSG